MAKGARGTSKPYLRGKIYWVKYYVEGEPVFESAKTAKLSEAVKFLNRKRSEADDGKLTFTKCRIAHLLELHVKQQKRLGRLDIPKVESRIANHLGPHIGKLLVSRLSTDHIEAYIDARLDEEAAPATICFHGTGGGGRTLIYSEVCGILSPVRLPVPPLQHSADSNITTNHTRFRALPYCSITSNTTPTQSTAAGIQKCVSVKIDLIIYPATGSNSLRSLSALNSHPIKAMQASK